jgi:hypothetical protein
MEAYFLKIKALGRSDPEDGRKRTAHGKEKEHDELGGIGQGVEDAALHQDGNHRVQAV